MRAARPRLTPASRALGGIPFHSARPDASRQSAAAKPAWIGIESGSGLAVR